DPPTTSAAGRQPAPAATEHLATPATVPAADDTNTANNPATDTDNLAPQPVVSVTKVDNKGGSSITGSTGTVVPGTSFTYTVSVSKTGPSTASNVTASDPVPSGLSPFSCSGNGQSHGY